MPAMTHHARSSGPGTRGGRGRGRPASEEAPDLRQRILHHAEAIFARSGLEATTVQQIADAAGVDRRLVYHYFRSKDKLYLEALGDIYGQLGTIATQLAEDAASLDVFVATLCRRFFAFCVAHENFVRMLMWENLREAQGLRTVAQASVVAQAIRQRVRPLIADAADDARCRPDVDPDMLIISCLGQCLYVLSNAASLSMIFDVDTREAAFRDRWLEHVVRVVLDGVRPGR